MSLVLSFNFKEMEDMFLRTLKSTPLELQDIKYVTATWSERDVTPIRNLLQLFSSTVCKKEPTGSYYVSPFKEKHLVNKRFIYTFQLPVNPSNKSVVLGILWYFYVKFGLDFAPTTTKKLKPTEWGEYSFLQKPFNPEEVYLTEDLVGSDAFSSVEEDSPIQRMEKAVQGNYFKIGQGTNSDFDILSCIRDVDFSALAPLIIKNAKSAIEASMLDKGYFSVFLLQTNILNTLRSLTLSDKDSIPYVPLLFLNNAHWVYETLSVLFKKKEIKKDFLHKLQAYYYLGVQARLFIYPTRSFMTNSKNFIFNSVKGICRTALAESYSFDSLVLYPEFSRLKDIIIYYPLDAIQEVEGDYAGYQDEFDRSKLIVVLKRVLPFKGAEAKNYSFSIGIKDSFTEVLLKDNEEPIAIDEFLEKYFKLSNVEYLVFWSDSGVFCTDTSYMKPDSAVQKEVFLPLIPDISYTKLPFLLQYGGV